MIPLRLVIDTNVVVSAALRPEGLQRTVVMLAVTKPVLRYVSEAIVSEYAMVLARPELKIRRGCAENCSN
jgi:putative PIN family toxin of toxin-antitoxin system